MKLQLQKVAQLLEPQWKKCFSLNVCFFLKRIKKENFFFPISFTSIHLFPLKGQQPCGRKFKISFSQQCRHDQPQKTMNTLAFLVKYLYRHSTQTSAYLYNMVAVSTKWKKKKVCGHYKEIQKTKEQLFSSSISNRFLILSAIISPYIFYFCLFCKSMKSIGK